MSAVTYLALDFGGSGVKGAIIQLSRSNDEPPKIVEKFRLPSQVSNFAHWFAHFDPLFAQFNARFPLQGIAISACAAVDADKGLVFGGSMVRYILDVNIKSLFAERYQLPVEVENDACCAALCEHNYGHHCHGSDLCLVAIGSGVGGAVISAGKLVKGHHHYTGEFGYAILGFENGQPKIASDLVSTRGLVNQAAKAMNVARDSLDGKKVFALYQQGDELVIEVVEKWIKNLTTLLFNLQYTLDPQAIVIGGAVSQQPLLIPLINKQLERYLFAMPYCHIKPEVVAAKYGNDANLIGAVVHFIAQQAK